MVHTYFIFLRYLVLTFSTHSSILFEKTKNLCNHYPD